MTRRTAAGPDRWAGDPRAITPQATSLAIGAFGKPHLFEWQVYGAGRLLVESSLAVFRREGRTPMSLKLVDLDAERPNTGAALSTWLDNAIAGVPELAVCYHRGGLIHHYDVLQTDDIAALCAPPFDPDVILAYAARVLEFLQHHCADDGSQYWLLGDGSAEGGLHLYDVTKGIIAASVGDERPGAGTTGVPRVVPRVPRVTRVRRADDGGRALPRDPSAFRGSTRPGPSTSRPTTTVRSVRSVLRSTIFDQGGGRPEPPGVAGAAGRYALLERVASPVLSLVGAPRDVLGVQGRTRGGVPRGGVGRSVPIRRSVNSWRRKRLTSRGAGTGKGKETGVGRGNRRRGARRSPRG